MFTLAKKVIARFFHHSDENPPGAAQDPGHITFGHQGRALGGGKYEIKIGSSLGEGKYKI